MTDMVDVQVSELSGAALDWAVAKAIGAYRGKYEMVKGSAPWDSWIFPDGFPRKATSGKFAPSTDWSQGGPLIQKHGCDLNCIAASNCWEANCWDDQMPTPSLHLAEAETPLIAACRAIVSAKLGDTVSVPAELAGGWE